MTNAPTNLRGTPARTPARREYYAAATRASENPADHGRGPPTGVGSPDGGAEVAARNPGAYYCLSLRLSADSYREERRHMDAKVPPPRVSAGPAVARVLLALLFTVAAAGVALAQQPDRHLAPPIANVGAV